MKKIKKTALKLACVLVGLNTFTACYGPAPFPDEDLIPRQEEATKASQDGSQDAPDGIEENDESENH